MEFFVCNCSVVICFIHLISLIQGISSSSEGDINQWVTNRLHFVAVFLFAGHLLGLSGKALPCLFHYSGLNIMLLSLIEEFFILCYTVPLSKYVS